MTFKWTSPDGLRIEATEFREEPGKLIIRTLITKSKRLDTLFVTGRYTLEFIDHVITIKEVDYTVIAADICFLLINSTPYAEAHLTVDSKIIEENLF